MERRIDATSTARSRPKRVSGGFDFTGALRALAADMVARLPELSHIDMAQVCVAFSSARSRSPYGIQASLTPLRFQGGELEGKRRGRRYRVQRVVDIHGNEVLYILTAYLPRFMDLPLDEKLITVLHELWHISPDFNGDIRRHTGRCYAHSSSKKAYDAEMARLANRWLANSPPEGLYAFLRHDFDGLVRTSGKLFGARIARPKLIPIA